MDQEGSNVLDSLTFDPAVRGYNNSTKPTETQNSNLDLPIKANVF